MDSSAFDGGTEYHSVLSATYVSAAVTAAPHSISAASVSGDKRLKSAPIIHTAVNGIHAVTSLTQNCQYGVRTRTTNLPIK